MSEPQMLAASDAQLAFARARSGMRIAQFMKGDAMALPFQAAKFDVATMALVIFFVPEPAKGVAEMVRVVAPGGEVAAYAWDFLGGRSPMYPVLTELEAIGFPPMRPPKPDAVANATPNVFVKFLPRSLEGLKRFRIQPLHNLLPQRRRKVRLVGHKHARLASAIALTTDKHAS